MNTFRALLKLVPIFILTTALASSLSVVSATQISLGMNEKPSDTQQQRLNTVVQNRVNTEGQQEARQELMTQAKIKACQKGQEVVTKQLNQYSQLRQGQTERYENLIKKTNEVITKAGAEGADVSSITSDVAELQAMIASHAQVIESYQNQLKGISTGLSDCSEPNADAKALLINARTTLQAVRKEAQAIRTFIQSTLLPDLKAVGVELRTMKQAEVQQKIRQTNPSPTPKPVGTPIEIESELR